MQLLCATGYKGQGSGGCHKALFSDQDIPAAELPYYLIFWLLYHEIAFKNMYFTNLNILSKQWKRLRQRVTTESILITSFDCYFIGFITLLLDWIKAGNQGTRNHVHGGFKTSQVFSSWDKSNLSVCCAVYRRICHWDRAYLRSYNPDFKQLKSFWVFKKYSSVVSTQQGCETGAGNHHHPYPLAWSMSM